MTDGPQVDFPPAIDLWLLHGSMGTAVMTADGPRVFMRLAARLNHGDEQDDRTYVLDQGQVTHVIAGLMQMGWSAFGRRSLMEGMAEHLGVPDDMVPGEL